MRNGLLTIIVIVVSISGCTHIHKIDMTSEYSKIKETNDHLHDQKTKITLIDSRTITALNPQITADSVSWFDPALDSRNSFHVSEIKNISILKRGRGAWEGFRVGAIFGGIAGLLFGGIATADDTPGRDPTLGADISPMAIAFIGAAGAGLIGLPIGAMTGSKDKYILIAPVDSLSNRIKSRQE
jgi:hypothetical protein